MARMRHLAAPGGGCHKPLAGGRQNRASCLLMGHLAVPAMKYHQWLRGTPMGRRTSRWQASPLSPWIATSSVDASLGWARARHGREWNGVGTVDSVLGRHSGGRRVDKAMLPLRLQPLKRGSNA